MAVAKRPPEKRPEPGERETGAEGAKKGGLQGWLNKGDNKWLAIGGGLVVAYALYQRSKSSSSASSSPTSTGASPVITTTSASPSPAPAQTVNVAGIEEQVAALAQQVNTLQRERTTPQTQLGSLFYEAEQDELAGKSSQADTAIHLAWEQAGRPHGLPIFQEPYPAGHSSGSGSQGGGSPSAGSSPTGGSSSSSPGAAGTGLTSRGNLPQGGHIGEPAYGATKKRRPPAKKRSTQPVSAHPVRRSARHKAAPVKVHRYKTNYKLLRRRLPQGGRLS